MPRIRLVFGEKYYGILAAAILDATRGRRGTSHETISNTEVDSGGWRITITVHSWILTCAECHIRLHLTLPIQIWISRVWHWSLEHCRLLPVTTITICIMSILSALVIGVIFKRSPEINDFNWIKSNKVQIWWEWACYGLIAQRNTFVNRTDVRFSRNEVLLYNRYSEVTHFVLSIDLFGRNNAWLSFASIEITLVWINSAVRVDYWNWFSPKRGATTEEQLILCAHVTASFFTKLLK